MTFEGGSVAGSYMQHIHGIAFGPTVEVVAPPVKAASYLAKVCPL